MFAQLSKNVTRSDMSKRLTSFTRYLAVKHLGRTVRQSYHGNLSNGSEIPLKGGISALSFVGTRYSLCSVPVLAFLTTKEHACFLKC